MRAITNDRPGLFWRVIVYAPLSIMRIVVARLYWGHLVVWGLRLAPEIGRR